MKTIYLDDCASTMTDPKVVKAMMPYFSQFYGNASSTHDMGMKSKIALNDARHIIAKAIGAKDEEIYFTSGGTESNNLALKGAAMAEAIRAGKAMKEKKAAASGKGVGKKEFRNHIITTNVEHSCILNSCKWLEEMGFTVTYLDVDTEGFVRLEDFKKAITDQTFLVSIIHANNEIGTINDLKTIGAICRKKGILLHTDACQSFTKVPIDVMKMNIDMMTLNSHKIHGPKGVGALYVRKGIELVPILHGGGHEHGLRSGTENIPGIVGFGEAVRLAKSGYVKDMIKLRDMFIDAVLEAVPDAVLNGPRDRGGSSKRTCNNVNITFPVSGEMLGDYLGFAGICTSKGSACASNESGAELSHVLKAIGRTDKQIKNSIRFSVSRFTTKKEIEETIKVLLKSVDKTRKSKYA